MITPAHSDLAYYLTLSYFGYEAANIVKILFKYDQASLDLIRSNLKQIRLNDIKRSLLILVKYQIVDYIKTFKNFKQLCEYSVSPHRMFCFYRMSRFLEIIPALEVNMTDNMMASLFTSGLIDKGKLSNLVANQPKDVLMQNVQSLISKAYIVETNNDLCLNFQRIHLQSRNKLIVDKIKIYYGGEPLVGHIAHGLLELSFDNTAEDAKITSPVPLVDIESYIFPKISSDKILLRKYLTKLSSDNKYWVPSGTHPIKGPMLAINISKVVDDLVIEHICSVIRTKFGPKCCRVFRVILDRGPLLLGQIEQYIMLPTRDVREYTYMLIKEGFIRNRQVPKTLDNAPSKSIFIMSVELDRVVNKVADLCCRTIRNLFIRQEYEVQSNQGILARSRAVKEIHHDASPLEFREHLTQYFNANELSQLDNVNSTLRKIDLTRSQVDETLMILHIWSQVRPDAE